MSHQTTLLQSHSLTLPNEIIYLVIQCIIPADRLKAIAIPSSDPITKTLLSLAQASRLTYPVAMRKLYSHCLYIDSFDRLSGLCRTLTSETFDSSFVARTLCIDSQEQQSPRQMLLQVATSLYLSPFSNSIANSVDQLAPICQLLEVLAPHIKRLVLSIPIHLRSPEMASPRMWGDLQNKHGLHEVLSNLQSLEVFCSVQGSLGRFEKYDHPGWFTHRDWSNLPKLRVVSLDRCRVSEETVRWVAESPHLERCIFGEATVSPSLTTGIQHCYTQAKREMEDYERAKRDANIMAIGEMNLESSSKQQELLFVSLESLGPRLGGQKDWEDDDQLHVETIQVARSHGSRPWIDDSGRCREWIMEKFISGDERFLG